MRRVTDGSRPRADPVPVRNTPGQDAPAGRAMWWMRIVLAALTAGAVGLASEVASGSVRAEVTQAESPDSMAITAAPWGI